MFEDKLQYNPSSDLQSVVPHWQSLELIIFPFVLRQMLGGRDEHVFVENLQYIPLNDVHSVVPHVQLVPAVFGVNALVNVHTTCAFVIGNNVANNRIPIIFFPN